LQNRQYFCMCCFCKLGNCQQGDQIGRFFAYWSIVCLCGLGSFLCGISPNYGLLFPRWKICIKINKNGLGYSLWIFSQTHLVTLIPTRRFFKRSIFPRMASPAKTFETRKKIRRGSWFPNSSDVAGRP
jgi:hypothetical protein